jgi:phosphatidylserine/phosphatidylglycerophosphate/cardiolipin synthase-like enzyme
MTRLALLTLATLLALASCQVGDAPGEDELLDEGALDDEPLDGEADLPADDDGAAHLAAATAPCKTSLLVGGIRTWFHFIRPNQPCRPTATGFASAARRDFNIVAELKRLIDSVPAGETIEGHIYEIEMDAIASALLAAQTRGVRVRISLDAAVAASVDPSKTRYIDKLRERAICTGQACIGTATYDAVASHVKLFTFSAGRAPDGTARRDIAWVSSANQTYDSGSQMFNNSQTFYGAPGVVSGMNRYLDDIFNQRKQRQYYDPASGRGLYREAPATFHASPSPDTDLVVAELRRVTPDSHCVVRLMQAFINDSRPKVIDQLVAMRRAGCKMQIVTSGIQPASLAKLKAVGAEIYKARVHDKTITLYGNVGGTYRYQVITGSHNIGSTSNNTNEELLVALAPEPAGDAARRPVYNLFYAHFWSAATGAPRL